MLAFYAYRPDTKRGDGDIRHSQNEIQTALDEIVEQISRLQPEAPLPMPLSAWLRWLEDRVDHPLKMTPVLDLDYRWERFMERQNHPLLYAASWYARKQENSIIRKVKVSKNFDNDRDYIVYTTKYAVTRLTKTSGSGSEAVYIYGFENDPDYLKIGKASSAADVNGAFQRVRQQTSTSNRTLPKLYHVIFTNNCARLEKSLHRHLKDKGHWAYDGAGKEWFKVSVQDVLAVYEEVRDFI